MNIFNIIPIKLAVFSSIYLIILIFFAPVIDHLFTTLEEDKQLNENNFKIMIEIISHAVILSISWYFLHKYLGRYLESALGVKIKPATKSAIDFASAIALIGLQRNLIDKLEYITFAHPFRLKDLYG